MGWLAFRVIILCAMFAVLTYQDIRTRTTDDRVLLAFGGVGAATYLADWESFDMLHVGLCMIGAVMGGFIAWRFSMFGMGDILALVTATVIFPLYENFPVILPVAIAAVVLMGIYITTVNVSYNVSDLARERLFAGVRDGALRKVAALFLLHRQRPRPRHVFSAQKETPDGVRLVLHQRDLNAAFAPRDSYEKQATLYPEQLRAEYAKASERLNMFTGIENYLKAAHAGDPAPRPEVAWDGRYRRMEERQERMQEDLQNITGAVADMLRIVDEYKHEGGRNGVQGGTAARKPTGMKDDWKNS